MYSNAVRIALRSTTTKSLFAQQSRLAAARFSTQTAEPQGLCADTGVAFSEDFRDKSKNLDSYTDAEIMSGLSSGTLRHQNLEDRLTSKHRAVVLRRQYLEESLAALNGQGAAKDVFSELPVDGYDYDTIYRANAENVVGYVPIPVGVCGPLLLDGHKYVVPMATTEGCLIASAHRGCKAITESGGARSAVLHDGMSRGPVIAMPSAMRAAEMKKWVENRENLQTLATAFNSTSRFARLQEIKAAVSGRLVFLRTVSSTGDAMGMNMLTKGATAALQVLYDTFPDMDLLSVSGNYCTDKKPSAINWLDGRGKAIVCEATIRKDVVHTTLKTNVDDLVRLNIAKNLIGSAMAGSVGGFNAHASNIVTAIFLATGQDPAQNIESSNCMTLMEKTPEGDLHLTVSMPSIEVGTVGGGTHLGPQASCLGLLGVRGAHPETPGQNAKTLARVIAGSVLAGELSLMSALAAGHLLKSHMELNRKKA